MAAKLRAVVGPSFKATIKAIPERLTLGRCIKGPDYGSGDYPVIFHSSQVVEHTRYRYVVGYHRYLREAIDRMCFGGLTDSDWHQEGDEFSRVRFFKGYAPAKRQFEELCAAHEKQEVKKG